MTPPAPGAPAAVVQEVAVVVPARDEEGLLPACLEALALAAHRCAVPTRTIVVLDCCADASVDICRDYGVETLEVSFANVGRARHAGVSRAIRSAVAAGSLWSGALSPDSLSPDSLWIANTDADSRVMPGWLAEQVRLADEGADAVVGLVDVDTDLPGPIRRVYAAAYRRRQGPNGVHDHVHGANLGVRASTYVEAGGFPPLAAHEDRELVARLRAMRHAAVVTASSSPVRTSARTVGRCRDGFAAALAELAAVDRCRGATAG